MSKPVATYPELRAKLVSRIQAVHKARRESLEHKEACDHKWATYRQTIVVENDKSPISAAFFIIRGCSLCKRKLLLDYVTE